MSPVPVKDLDRLAKAGHPRPDSLPAKVLRALQADQEQAWRASELARKCRADIHAVGSALRRLRARGLVDRKHQHWFALDDAEVAEFQAMLITTRLANERLGPERLEDWLPAQGRSRRLGKSRKGRTRPTSPDAVPRRRRRVGS